MGDAEYLAAFHQLLMPIANQFNPELVLVAAGFDGAQGDKMGMCKLTPAGYGLMTHLLSSLARGRVALLLEGGYNLDATANSMVMCTKALLQRPLTKPTITAVRPSANAAIRDAKEAHLPFWSSLSSMQNPNPSLVDQMNELTMQPKVMVKKIGPQELAGRARIGLLRNPPNSQPPQDDEPKYTVRPRTSVSTLKT